MSFRIKPVRPGYADYADASDFKAYLGVEPSSNWPAHAIEAVQVSTTKGETVPLWLEAADYDPSAKRTRREKTSKHRCFTRCPSCGKVVGAGRTHQHKCK